MLGNLISAIMLTTAIGIGGPLNSSTDYQDVNVTETYEYETNEVNSENDLVQGNIYKYHINQNDTLPSGRLFNCTYIRLNTEEYQFNVEYKATFLNLRNNEDTFALYFSSANMQLPPVWQIYKVDLPQDFYFYFVYYVEHIPYGNLIIENISASDYLGEKTVTVTPIEYDGMFAIFTNFLYSRLFSGDVLTSMETTILGQTLTLGQWVSSSVAIVILCLIVFMLVKFVIFLFKVVGGAFLWK